MGVLLINSVRNTVSGNRLVEKLIIFGDTLRSEFFICKIYTTQDDFMALCSMLREGE